MKAAALNAKGRPRKKRDNTKPRTQSKRGLLGFILSDPRLDAAAGRAIREAHEDGCSISDLSALTAYELCMARFGFESGELALKDLIVALNKTASHVAAAAQLGAAAGGGTGAAAITITFSGTGPAGAHPDAAAKPAPHAVMGDTIDTDG